jgi:ABC-type transport system substrate-binding protein
MEVGMIATMQRAGLVALLAGFLAAPALVAMAGVDMDDFNAVPAEAAGSTVHAGSTRSPSGLDPDSGSDMAHSSADLPDNDAGAPVNNGLADQGTLRGFLESLSR